MFCSLKRLVFSLVLASFIMLLVLVKWTSMKWTITRNNFSEDCVGIDTKTWGHQVHQAQLDRENDSTVARRHADRAENTIETTLDFTAQHCPTLKSPVLPFPTNIPPPCESNQHFYSSPLFCHTVKKPLLLILVLSHVGEFGRRQEIRKRWVRSTFHMSSDFIAAHPWAYTFVVGRPSGNNATEVMKSVGVERCHYKDVLTVDVLENYYNLTWKKMDALEYLVKSRFAFDVVLKTDSDVYLNIQLILEWLPDALSQSYSKSNFSVRPFYAGNCRLSAHPLRVSQNKWYLSWKDYPPTKFPPFCFGVAYFLSVDLVRAMLNLSDLRRTFRLEDVHTGLLVNDTGLVPRHHVVDPGRIYNFDRGRCTGFKSHHQYPFAVAGYNILASFKHYNDFMRSLCK